MSVIRIKHSQDFTVLSNSTLWLTELSNEAIGLWARCMSRPNNWTFYVSELANTLKKNKKTSLYSSIRELIEAKLVLRIEYFEEGQKFIKRRKVGEKIEGKTMEYVFFPFPQNDSEIEKFLYEFKLSLLHSGFLNPVIMNLGNRQLQKIKKKRKTYVKETPTTTLLISEEKKECVVADSSKESQKEEEGEEGLRELFRKELTESQTIEAMAYWKANTDKLSEKDHPHKYVIWIIKNDKHLSQKLKRQLESKQVQPDVSPASQVVNPEIPKPKEVKKEKSQEEKNKDFALNYKSIGLFIRKGLIWFEETYVQFPSIEDKFNNKLYFIDAGFVESFENYIRKIDPRYKEFVI